MAAATPRPLSRAALHHDAVNSSSAGAHDEESQQLEEVNRIFSTSTIEQVAATCRAMQGDVRQTQQELRQMVGNRHRELIDCCGALVGIDQVCREVAELCEQVSERRAHNSPLLYERASSNGGGSGGGLAKPGATAASAASGSTASVVATAAKKAEWHRQQMLQALRATQLVEGGQLLAAAVQICSLERDAALAAAADALGGAVAGASALDGTLRRLKQQWGVAASKAVADVTCDRSSGDDASAAAEAAVVLSSCFQGHGLLHRAEPAQSLQYLLHDLCPQALQRIRRSHDAGPSVAVSAGNSALARSTRLLAILTRFVGDLYRRGQLALITVDTIDAATGCGNAAATTSAVSAAAGLSAVLFNSSEGSLARSRGSGAASTATVNGSVGAVEELVKLREDGGRFAALSSHADAAAYLSQIATRVCALGALDASSATAATTRPSASSAPGGWASPTGASPEFATPGKTQPPASAAPTPSLALPGLEELLRVFRAACKDVFASSMTALVLRAADPAAGETLVGAILAENSRRLLAAAAATGAVPVLLRCVEEEVRAQIAAAAGKCMLEHLSGAARRLLSAVLGKSESGAGAGAGRSIFTAALSLGKDGGATASSVLAAAPQGGTSNNSTAVTRSARAMLSTLVSNRQGRRGNANVAGDAPNAAAAVAASGSALLAGSGAPQQIQQVAALTAQTVQFARSALQRCAAVGDHRGTEHVTEIVRELVEGISAEARSFFEQQQHSAAASSSPSSAVQAGIVATATARSTCEQLLQLVAASTASSSAAAKSAAAALAELQARALKPWCADVLAAFQRDCAALRESGAADAAAGCSYTAPVLSGSWLVCRRRQLPTDDIELPWRPTPQLLTALIHVAQRVTAPLAPLPGSSGGAGTGSGGGGASCPLHVRTELCSQLALWLLERGTATIDAIAQRHIGGKEQDQRLMQLYFDVLFGAALMHEDSRSAQPHHAKHQHRHHHDAELLARVESRRKMFHDELGRRVDGIVWATSKAAVDRNVKRALAETALIASPLTSVPFAAAAAGGGGVTSTPAVAATLLPFALQPSVAAAAERLPVLPLVSITPSASTSAAAAAAAAASVGSSGGATGGGSGGMAAGGMMAGLLGGGGGGTAGASVGNTAQQIGLAVQDRLKDVLKWF